MEGAVGGLHKRSAEDWGDSLRAPGAELLRKAWLPCLERVSADGIAFRGVAGCPRFKRGRKTAASPQAGESEDFSP
jgi:hypothetical protein